MILTSLELDDIGAFRGKHHIELRPLGTDRPIVLVGGPNGAGKTTLLEAVRLCLYGRRALGRRVAEAGYEERLRQLFHVDLAPRASASMGAALSFEHVHAGLRTVYRVHRQWRRRGQRVTEHLEVQRDGATLPRTDAGRWQDFLYQLLPPTLAELSFFDGERIRDLADDVTGLEMANAIRALLGLDVVDQLQTDLGLFITRQGHQGDGALETQISELVRERSEARPTAERLDEEVRATRHEAERTERSLQRIEDELSRQGGSAAARRADLRARIQELEERARLASDELRELCAGLLPLAVAQGILARSQAGLEAERRLQQSRIQDKAARRLARQLLDGAGDDTWRAEAERLGLSSAQLEGLFSVVARRLQSPEATSADLPSLGLRSIDEPLDLLRNAAADAARARRLGKQLSRIRRDRHIAEEELARAPEPARIEPLLEKLRVGHARLTGLHDQIATLQARLSEVASTNRRIDARLRYLHDEAGEMQSREQQTALAGRVAVALSRFGDRLADARLSEVETSIQRTLADVLTSPIIAEVRIDRSSLGVILGDADGRRIDRETLSAGQRQIYAMAFMLGLVRASRRRLPLIIDSPLGRLDALHRQRLAHRYFPHAADQVIILSTDTEVDAHLFQILEPSISRSYRLEHNPLSRTSTLQPSSDGGPSEDAGVMEVRHVSQETIAVG